MRRRIIPLTLLGLILIAGFGLLWKGKLSRAQTDTQTASVAEPAATSDSGTVSTYSLFAGLWRTDGGFVSTIQVKNSLVVAPLEVTPVIFFADGTEYDLAPVQLPETGVTTINVNQAIANIPPEMASHLSDFGSAALRYDYTSPGHVLGAVQILDIQQSLIFTNAFGDFAVSDASTQTIEGVWWRRDPGVVGFVSLSNPTGGPKDVTVQAIGSRGTALAPQVVTVAAHATQMLDLDALAAGLPGLENQAGGLRVQYNGKLGEVNVLGGLVNEREGYSASLPFWGHDLSASDPTSITFASVGVRVGAPDPAAGFPGGTKFIPYAVLRNTTAGPLQVQATVNTMRGGKPASVALPSLQLKPFETRQLDFESILDSAGLDKLSGSLNLSLAFTGHGGDLVFATGSVDQTGTYVFEVEPQGVGRSMSKETGYWTVANGFDTMFSMWNPTSQAQDFMVDFFYGDGSGKYTLPVHLEGQASRMIDLAMLISEQQPDPDGHLIPPGVQSGSVAFSNAGGMTEWMSLVVSGGIFNVQAATCGSTCIYCCGFSSPRIEPNPLTVAVGKTGQMNTKANYCTGIPYILSSTWSSKSTSVATVSGGTVTGKSAGSATIEATFLPIVMYTGTICAQFNPVCPAGTPTVSGTANVRLPHHLQVISDDSGLLVQCQTIVGRRIKMKVVDVNNTIVGYAPIKENFLSMSTNTCGDGQPLPTPCGDTDNANSEFTDGITVNCNNVGGSCGYNITYEWQWCPSGSPAVNIGKFIETVHANAITVNGVTTPNKIPAGTNIFP